MAHPQLGDLLVSSGVIAQEQLGQALARQKETKKRLGEALIDDGIITEQQLIDTLRLQLGIEFVDLSAVEPDPQLVDVLPRNIAKKYGVTPVRLHGNTLYLAMSDPLNFMAQEEVRAATHRRVVPMITTADGIERANASLYGGEGAQRAIRDMRLTVLTNSLLIADVLSHSESIRLQVIGGVLQPQSMSFLGEAALAALAPYYVDSAFVSCRSVSLDRGITDSNEQSAAFRSDAIRRAGRVYLVADHTKFGQTSFVQICGFDALAGIVTDQPLSAPWHWMAQERKLLLLENAPEA